MRRGGGRGRRVVRGTRRPPSSSRDKRPASDDADAPEADDLEADDLEVGDLVSDGAGVVARLRAEVERRRRNVIVAACVVGLLWYKGK